MHAPNDIRLGRFVLELGLALVVGCKSPSPQAAAPLGQWSEDGAAPAPQASVGLLYPPTAPPAAAKNPFEGASFFRDPHYGELVRATLDQSPEDLRAAIEVVANVPTALWLESIESVARLRGWLEAASAEARATGNQVVVVVVLYDLPNRDCSASASPGELHGERGEARYEAEFIDPIAAQVASMPEQRVVFILEPDALPNLATNQSVERCREARDIQRRSLAYAVSRLSRPNAFLYLDAAHAGWLGWKQNREALLRASEDVLAMAGGSDRIRGFATNVGNYNALDGDWGKMLEPKNPCANEMDYVRALAEDLAARGVEDKGFIVDTSRNGVAEIRSVWGNWCNIEGAGLGERPRAAPRPLVDAYYWVKPPGESDGVSDPAAEHFDPLCASPDSARNAPAVREWFPSYFVDLVRNSNPPL